MGSLMLSDRLLKFIVLFAIVAAPVASYAQAAPELNLLAMGDWGEAKSAQSAVAQAMTNYVAAQARPINAMILAGDNFYVPLSGVEDEAWQSLFEQMYDPKKLSFPFYVSLGNHDYDNGKFKIELDYARLHPQSRWKFPARWYRIDLPANKPLATILMLD